MWYIYTEEYYSAIKKNETLSFVTTGMELEGIRLTEIRQTEKDKYCDFIYMWNLNKQNKQNKTETRS